MILPSTATQLPAIATLGGQLGSPPAVMGALNSAGALHAVGEQLGEIGPDARTKQALVDFEAVFVSALIKQMRQSIDGDGLFPGDKSDTLGGLFDLFMGQHLAQSGGLGMSEAFRDTYVKSSL